ncbi:hypothetical protein [Parafrankia sp. BMG5.11]|uniref:hypothetical protein n=1 Tax=Parafrankia sp. BMG5.11 TaxID=222540 RepID=UPI001404AF4D|nr:hypothetical protein [Parafrankia sp. BMG5.11]
MNDVAQSAAIDRLAADRAFVEMVRLGQVGRCDRSAIGDLTSVQEIGFTTPIRTG